MTRTIYLRFFRAEALVRTRDDLFEWTLGPYETIQVTHDYVRADGTMQVAGYGDDWWLSPDLAPDHAPWSGFITYSDAATGAYTDEDVAIGAQAIVEAQAVYHDRRRALSLEQYGHTGAHIGTIPYPGPSDWARAVLEEVKRSRSFSRKETP